MTKFKSFINWNRKSKETTFKEHKKSHLDWCKKVDQLISELKHKNKTFTD